MSSSQKTIDYLIDQMSQAGQIRTRKLFSEYAIYCDSKVVAFVCDDELFVKPTDAGRQSIGSVVEKPAYPGSKLYFWISGDQWEDPDWLSQLIQRTATVLPLPTKK